MKLLKPISLCIIGTLIFGVNSSAQNSNVPPGKYSATYKNKKSNVTTKVDCNFQGTNFDCQSYKEGSKKLKKRSYKLKPTKVDASIVLRDSTAKNSQKAFAKTMANMAFLRASNEKHVPVYKWDMSKGKPRLVVKSKWAKWSRYQTLIQTGNFSLNSTRTFTPIDPSTQDETDDWVSRTNRAECTEILQAQGCGWADPHFYYAHIASDNAILAFECYCTEKTPPSAGPAPDDPAGNTPAPGLPPGPGASPDLSGCCGPEIFITDEEYADAESINELDGDFCEFNPDHEECSGEENGEGEEEDGGEGGENDGTESE